MKNMKLAEMSKNMFASGFFQCAKHAGEIFTVSLQEKHYA